MQQSKMVLRGMVLPFPLVYCFHCPTFLFSSAALGSPPFRKHAKLAYDVINSNTSLLWQRLTAVLLLHVAQQTATAS